MGVTHFQGFQLSNFEISLMTVLHLFREREREMSDNGYLKALSGKKRKSATARDKTGKLISDTSTFLNC